MIINRIVYVILVIAALVFSTLYGGYIPELIRDTLILLPVLLILYLSLVYVRLRPRQSIGQHIPVKGYPINYTLEITNPDVISYNNIGIHFHDKVADISVSDEFRRISLRPKERVISEGQITCKYAGVYNVGVSTIDIPDFFNIFHIRYKLPRPVRVHVRPEKLVITAIRSSLLGGSGNRTSSTLSRASDYCGGMVRDYIPGDSLKRIHWKNSAKMNKLVTKQIDEVNEPGSALVVDTGLYKYPANDRIVVVDKILHIIVALVNSWVTEAMNTEVFYSYKNRIKSTYISETQEFNNFYDTCQDINFLENTSIADVMAQVHTMNRAVARNMVIVSADVDEKIHGVVKECQRTGCSVTIINIIRNGMQAVPVDDTYNVINIGVDDDICEVLSE